MGGDPAVPKRSAGARLRAAAKDQGRAPDPRRALAMWDWAPLRDWIAGYIMPYWTTPLLLAVQTLIVMISIILVMAFYTLAERKVIGWIQYRRGPNRVGLWGFGQA